MAHVQEIISRILEPGVIEKLKWGLIAFFYVIGRITKSQFMAEQAQVHGELDINQTKKDFAVNIATGPATFIFDILNQIPVINTKIPFLNVSIPDIGKTVIQWPIGVASDVLHNAPIIGSNIKKDH